MNTQQQPVDPAGSPPRPPRYRPSSAEDPASLRVAQERAAELARARSRQPVEGPGRVAHVAVPVLDPREVPLEVAIFLAPTEATTPSGTTPSGGLRS